MHTNPTRLQEGAGLTPECGEGLYVHMGLGPVATGAPGMQTQKSTLSQALPVSLRKMMFCMAL